MNPVAPDQTAAIPRDELLAYVQRMRGVEDPCDDCAGLGVKSYGSCATWRGGASGQMITIDVCDRCWGSGDVYRPGADLRRLRDEEAQRVAAAAVDLLARSAGMSYGETFPVTAALIELLEAFAAALEQRTRAAATITLRVRRPPPDPYGNRYGHFARRLATVLRLARERAPKA